MRINVLGAGPAGLYFSILMKRADPSHDVRVFERNDPDATFGWGVVFSEGSLDELERADPESYASITDAWARWNPLDIRFHGVRRRVHGNVFSGVSRKRLLNILQARAAEVGVELVFHHEFDSLAPFTDADLVIGCDGVNSTVRRALEAELRPRIEPASSKYAWYGADFALPVFTYAFKDSEWGVFQAHCYPFDADRSTVIVLVTEATWRRAGLDVMPEEDSLRFCEGVFADELGGHRLLANRSLWTSFPWIRCENWHHGNIVMLGDAIHTAHWSIGSGTKLALEDAISLARAHSRHRGDLRAAVAEYELERQPAVERLQRAARVSLEYFESIQRYFHFEAPQFAYQLMTRARITHQNLSARDPEFARETEAWFWEQAGGGPRAVAPPPAFAPLRLRSVELPNRIVFREPVPGGGAGLVLSRAHAVSEEGRADPETPVEVQPPAPGPVVALRLSHAGARAACRPAAAAVDHPLPAGDRPPLLSASAVAYAPWMPVPAELDAAGMARVRDAFAGAARRVAAAGHRCLLLDFAQGELVASFLSPLTNRRIDGHGGPIEARVRFPLAVLAAVREEWPRDLPVMVAISASDRLPGGLAQADAVAVARAMREAGADAILVLMGQTLAEERADFGRTYGVPAADVLRNEARVATIAAGHIGTLDEVNTIVAAGRADLCVLDLRRGPGGGAA